MPFCTFCGLELTPKENDLFFCEKCGTYFETVKQNTPSAADVGAESRFVVTKTFKIFGTKKPLYRAMFRATPHWRFPVGHTLHPPITAMCRRLWYHPSDCPKTQTKATAL